jgi:hypothetical protein
MACPLVSVSGVRVSLQVITMHPMDLGAWDLCSWGVAAVLMIQMKDLSAVSHQQLAFRAMLTTESYSYFQTASGFSFSAGFPPFMCSSMIVATSASVTLEYQVASG